MFDDIYREANHQTDITLFYSIGVVFLQIMGEILGPLSESIWSCREPRRWCNFCFTKLAANPRVCGRHGRFEFNRSKSDRQLLGFGAIERR